ncbi:MAG: S9 family peptidase, partial [Chloroflexota bacterium]
SVGCACKPSFFVKNSRSPRWLEDADAEETVEWTQEQHDFAFELLSTMPGREAFRSRLTEVWDYPKYGIPRQRGERLFFTKNDGLQAQPTLYVQDGDAEPRVLLDPNTLSDDGTVAMVDWQPTDDGKYLMYAVSESGLDWRTFKIRDVDTGEDLSDVLENIKFSSAAWRRDKSGFYYSRFPEGTHDEGEDNQKVSHNLFFHTLGTEQSEDRLVYKHPDLEGVNFWSYVSHDDRFLFVHVTGDSFVFNRLYYSDITRDDTQFVRLFDELDASYGVVHVDGDIFYILTTKDAPNKRLMALDINQPDNWQEVIPESENVINGVAFANDQFIITYMQDAHHIVKIFAKDGTYIRDIELPTIGSTGFSAGWGSSPTDTSIFIPFMSYLQPLSILKYDLESNEMTTVFDTSVPTFDVDAYETKQVFFESKDGTRVPMFITAKKGIELNGDNPTILYGYGGYDISLTPGYASHLPVWLENG